VILPAASGQGQILRRGGEKNGIRGGPLTDLLILTSTVELPTLAAFSSSASPREAPEWRCFWRGRLEGRRRFPAVRRAASPRPYMSCTELVGLPGCPGCRSSEDTGYADRDHRTPAD
jgi:hypothetical protein